MNMNLFSAGDTVLLIGEGNFSFAVGLSKLNLLLKITATCFESEDIVQAFSNDSSQNIEYLKSTDVRVLIGVDGTELVKHPILGSEKFSKIIFNFPHVGGKMKIHLNRLLLRDFLQSASHLLEPDGQVLVSLCRGQGGTAADVPVRRWDDTWQVVEMAAYSNLVLAAVEPFRQDLIPNYSSIGYRSRDSSFHTDGALVHVFRKVDPLYPNLNISVLLQSIELQTLCTQFGIIECPSIYYAKYKCNPAQVKDSPIYFMCEQLKLSVENQLTSSKTGWLKAKFITDTEIPLHTEKKDGKLLCSFENCSFRCELRHSLLNGVDEIFSACNYETNGIVMFSGLVFNDLGNNFSLPPVSNHVLLLGSNTSMLVINYINHLLTIVKDCQYESSIQKHIQHCDVSCYTCTCKSVETTSVNDFVLTIPSSTNHSDKIIVGQDCVIKLKHESEVFNVSASYIYLDKLAQVFFKLQNWRELWACNERLEIIMGQPVLKLPSLYHRSYTFDICFTSEKGFNCKSLYNVLWQLAGDIIINVEFLNLYVSPKGWRSQCYRIIYQSFDKALCREKVINIHHNVIGKIVCAKLGVSMN